MALVSPAEVKQLIDTDLSDPTILVYITSADNVITELFDEDTTVTDSQKKELERWLTAHLIACTQEPQISQVGVSGTSVKYQGVTGKGLESTFYGQQVLVLDTAGKLRNLGKRQASIFAIPTEDS